MTDTDQLPGSSSPPPSSSSGGGPSWPPPSDWWTPPGGWGQGPYAPQWPPPRRRLPTALGAVLLAAAVLVGVAVGHGFWPQQSASASGGGAASPFNGPFGGGFPPGQGGEGPVPVPNGSGPAPEGAGGPANVGAIAAKIDPALVFVNDTFGYQGVQGAGTGIVLSSDGLVLTNNHVIDGETQLSVTDVGNGKTYHASVVGYDDSRDVALLKLQGASGLKVATPASSAPTVGEPVVVVGNAGGAGGTPTASGGSVTALNRSISAGDALDGSSEQLSRLIQVNADIQSGDSGGALVNTAGQVLGMNTAATPQFSFQASNGQGFAIPIREALDIVRQIRSGHGTSTVHVGATAFIGLLISPQGPQTGSGGFGGGGGFNQGGGGTVNGAYVSGVVSGGPAQRAGIGSGDVITAFGGHPVTNASALTALLIPYHPGQQAPIQWTDSAGQTHQGTVTLASGPPA